MRAASAYSAVRRAGLAEGATPYQLTLMLFDAALARIETARELDGENQRSTRQSALSRALAIVHELQGSLRDPDRDDLAGSLYVLYSHVSEQLLEASRTGRQEPLVAASEVLGMLREGWVGIDADRAA